MTCGHLAPAAGQFDWRSACAAAVASGPFDRTSSPSPFTHQYDQSAVMLDQNDHHPGSGHFEGMAYATPAQLNHSGYDNRLDHFINFVMI